MTAIAPASLRIFTWSGNILQKWIFSRNFQNSLWQTINIIKILYKECKKNISKSTLPKISNFKVGNVSRKQLLLSYLKLKKGQTAVFLR